jgi:DNA polymerase III subunit delta
MAIPPVIYLLHGDDEFAMTQFIADMETKVGDPGTAAMNITRLDGRTYNLDQLLSVASTMPFLARRRLVILSEFSGRVSGETARKSFTGMLEKVPATTALVLIEPKPLTSWSDRKKGKLHWLEKWATQQGDGVLIKEFSLPKGRALIGWIQEQARQAGGQFAPQAAELLATLVDEDPRQANQEIHKLLTYVNYRRPVEPDDVQNLTADSNQGDIFAMVDAIGLQDSRTAASMLHRLLETQEPISLFGMIVRQFRLLLLAREVLDQGGDVPRQLHIHPFVADKISVQARRFRLSDLEAVYHRLVDLDEAIKTGKIEAEIGLDTFIATFTTS